MFVWGNDWGDAMEAEDGDQGFMDFVADVDMGAGALQWEVSELPRDLAAAAPEVPKESQGEGLPDSSQIRYQKRRK